jgi:multiple sugar transport system substrate-binding protein
MGHNSATTVDAPRERSQPLLTRREVVRRAGTATALVTTAPWWLVRGAHAARQTKLVVWVPATLAPQVDRLLKAQCYAYSTQAGLTAGELDYAVMSPEQLVPKLVATLEVGSPPDVTLLGSGLPALYRSQGHLLEVTDLVEQMQHVPGGLVPAALQDVLYKGKAFGVPQSVSPWPLVTRLDLLEAATVEPPTTWDAFIEVCTKLQKPPRLTGYGMCLGLATDADHTIMQTIWGYGGTLVDADTTTVALHSQGTIQAVQLIAEMYHTHKIIPPGAVTWDNSGNNKVYQSRRALCVLNPPSLYAYLGAADTELATVTGLLPLPAGRTGAMGELTTATWVLFKHTPYPEIAKGLVASWMAPENLRVVMEAGGGLWGPPYTGMYDTAFWRRPVFQHWRGMLERGRTFAPPGTPHAAADEVLATHTLARMMQRVLVERWEAEKAVAAAHQQVAAIYARHQAG